MRSLMSVGNTKQQTSGDRFLVEMKRKKICCSYFRLLENQTYRVYKYYSVEVSGLD